MHRFTDEIIQQIIITLKDIDARGFDSMNRLVSLVGFFENVLNHPPADEENEGS